MSGRTTTADRDVTKFAILLRSRNGSPFVARVPGRPGESGYDPNGRKTMYIRGLVAKTETARLAALQTAIDAAQREQFGDRTPPALRVPISDGDERNADGGYVNAGDEFRGQMIIRVRASEDRMPPVLRGPAGAQVQAFPRDYQPGYWLMIVGRAFGYSRSGNHGISLGVNAVNIVAEDTPFTSDEPINDLDSAMQGVTLPASAKPASPPKPPGPNDNPAAQFA